MSIQSEIISEPDTSGDRASAVIGGSVVFVAVRCTLQYIVLPFVLPFFGVGDLFSVAITFVLELVALGTIFYNVHRLWNTSWRWRYLTFSTFIAAMIIYFLYEDVHLLLGVA